MLSAGGLRRATMLPAALRRTRFRLRHGRRAWEGPVSPVVAPLFLRRAIPAVPALPSWRPLFSTSAGGGALTPGAVATDSVDYASMTVAQLREELRGRGLKVGGQKAELIARLRGSGTTVAPPADADGADYAKMTVAQLQDELRGKGLKVSGQKAELLARLRELGTAAVPPPAADVADCAKMTVAQLQNELRERGLKVSGKKAELLARLREHGTLATHPAAADVSTGEESSFSSLIKASPDLLCAKPKSLLIHVLRRQGVLALQPGNFSVGNLFSVHAMKRGSDTLYRATYTDAETGEQFSSGLAGGIQAENGRSISLETPLQQAEVEIFEGKVYYREPTLAEHAAAARAIDCYTLREESVDKGGADADRARREGVLCLEDPYKTREEGLAQNIDYDALLAQKNLMITSETTEWKPVLLKKQSSFTEFVYTHTSWLHAPKRLLIDAGKICYGEGYSVLSTFEVERRQLGDEMFYHATFTEPITKEKFSSGLGGEIHVEKDYRYSLKTPLHQVEVKICDGKVYYRKLKLAEHAAAARAIDCYLLREESMDAGQYRLCCEDPYKTIEEGLSQEIDYGALLEKRNSKKTEWEPKSSFSNFVHAQPYRLHAPKSLLLNAGAGCYGRGYADLSIFTVERRDLGDEIFYHATFTDPINKESFSSGLGRKINVEQRRGSSLGTPLHQVEVKICDGKVYYREPKLAEHAAAARAIDCYLLREESMDANECRLCLEDPYKTIEEGLAQEIDYGALLEKRNLIVASEKTVWEPLSSKKQASFSDFAHAQPYSLHVPKSFLLSAGVACYGRDYSDLSSFKVEKRDLGDEVFYHATFIDPKTKEGFSSGLGGKINAEKRRSSSLKTPLHQAEVKIFDGKVYYRDLKLAEHAAAARAIDCYLLREGKQSFDKLCMEEPYYTAIEKEAQRLDYSMLLSKRNTVQDFRRGTFDSTQGGQVQGFSQVDAGKEGSSFDERINNTSKIKGAEDFQANPMELPTLSFSSTDEPMLVNNTLSTIGRIAEIWTDTTNNDCPSKPLQPRIVKSTRQYGDALSPTSKIKGIRDWYKQINSEPRSEEAFALTQLYTKILMALGKANHELYLNKVEESNINVQKDAKKILLKIMSLARSNHYDVLTADLCNSYLWCLSHVDPPRSAKTAQDLLKRMENGEKYYGTDLPTPNIGTYNATMALWALNDGIAGQNGVNNVYQQLVEESKSASSSGSDCSLLPNEDTFKTLLAVNSKVDNKFSFEQAKSWLEKIKETSNATGNESFISDASIYNAALNASSAEFTLYSTENSFLNYGKQFDGGFKDTFSHTEANDIANWLLYTEECGVKPNVEMYEAVIQSWIKTGSKEGLLSAEEWAKRAISSSLPIRLQTFHPIIAAWALCRSERAADRVSEWNRQLSAVGIKPDLNTLSAEIFAWKNVQAEKITRMNETLKKQTKHQTDQKSEMQTNMETVFSVAQNCTKILTNILRDWNIDSDEGLQDAALLSMFTHTIQAWGNASRFSLVQPTSSLYLNASYGVSEMLKNLRMFDSKICDDYDSEEYSQHLLSLMGQVYTEVAMQLHQIGSVDCSSPDEANTVCYFLDEIAEVERMLRNYEFYSRKSSQNSTFTPESKAIRFALYKSILRGCRSIEPSRDDGHVIRLCNLIMNHLSWQNKNCHEIVSGRGAEEDDITDIFVTITLLTGTIVKDPHQLMGVLTTVYNNASPFFVRKMKLRASSYAAVDRARLIEAIREAMGESELTESFLHKYEERRQERRPQQNTAMTFVREMMSKNRKHSVKNRQS